MATFNKCVTHNNNLADFRATMAKRIVLYIDNGYRNARADSIYLCAGKARAFFGAFLVGAYPRPGAFRPRVAMVVYKIPKNKNRHTTSVS